MKHWIRLVSVAVTAAASFFALSCGKVIKRPVEDRVSGPFSILSIPNRSDVVVINSSTSGEFEDGSLSLYTAEADGKMSLKTSYSTTRMGLSGAVSGDGKLIAVAFSDENPELRFFGLENDSITEKKSLRVSLPFTVFVQMRFFTPTSGDPSHYYLFGASQTGRVLAFRIEPEKTTRLFTLPEDMPGEKPEGYMLAVGAPVYVEKSDLLVSFPILTSDTSSLRPNSNIATAYQVGAGAWDPVVNKSGDIRALSTLVIDFEKYLADDSLRNAVAYIPFIHNDDYAVPVAGVAEDSTKKAKYRYSFQNSVYVNHSGCVTRNPGTFSDDSVLVSQNPTDDTENKKRGYILELTGWDTVKTNLTNLAAATSDADFDYRKKLVFQNATLKLFSNAEDLNLAATSRLTSIEILEQNSSCLPVWGRIETGKSVSGMEKIRLVTQIGPATQKPIESKSSLLPRGVKNITTLGSLIFASSYSYDVLKSVKFENNQFSVVP